MKKLFKILFSVFFFAVALIWTWFAVETFIPNEIPADWMILSKWEWFQSTIVSPINESLVDKPDSAMNGYHLVLIAGAILLSYTSIMFLIEKIPVIGKFIKTISSFVSFVSIVVIVVGALLWAGILS